MKVKWDTISGSVLGSLLVIQLIFLSSCASLNWTKASEENFREVKVGQTQEQVKNLIGAPQSESADVASGVSQQTLKYQILRADRRSFDPYKLIFKLGRLTEIVYDTQTARGQAELAERRKNSAQKCESMRPEISQANQKPDTRPMPDSCEAAPPLK